MRSINPRFTYFTYLLTYWQPSDFSEHILRIMFGSYSAVTCTEVIDETSEVEGADVNDLVKRDTVQDTGMKLSYTALVT